MKRRFILALTLCLPLRVHASVPVVDVIRNTIATMEMAEAITQTAHMVKDAASQATQIANQTTQIMHLVNQVKALTEGGAFGTLLEGMAMDELRRYAPELTTLIDVFDGAGGGHGDIRLYAKALESIADLVDADELFGEITVLSEAGAAIHEAYSTARNRIGGRYAIARASETTLPRRTEVLEILTSHIDKTKNVTQATNLNTRMVAELGHQQNEILRLQALALQQTAEKEAQELAGMTRYKAEMRNYLIAEGVYE